MGRGFPLGFRADDPALVAASRHVMAAEIVDMLRSMEKLPDGVVTFLFTDVEGSTRLWEEASDLMMDALRLHDGVISAAVQAHGESLCRTSTRSPDPLQERPGGRASPFSVRRSTGRPRWHPVRSVSSCRPAPVGGR